MGSTEGVLRHKMRSFCMANNKYVAVATYNNSFPIFLATTKVSIFLIDTVASISSMSGASWAAARGGEGQALFNTVCQRCVRGGGEEWLFRV